MISPIEIRQQSFGKALRGFDADEVKAFLNSLSKEWEKVLEENKKLKNELEHANGSLKSFKDMESILHKTLLQAEQSSKHVVENANKDAELKLKAAQQQADTLIAQAEAQTRQARQEVADLNKRRNELLEQMNVFLHAQLERMRSFEGLQTVTVSGSPVPHHTTPKVVRAEKSFFEQHAGATTQEVVQDIVNQL